MTAYLLAHRGVGVVTSVSVVVAIADDAVEGLTMYWLGPWAALLLLALVLPSSILTRLQPPAEDAS